MNKRLRVSLLVAFFPFSLFSFSSLAQTAPPAVTRLLEVGVSSNAYRGDLATKYQKWASGFQLGLKLNAKKRLNGHFNLGIGSITGQNPNYQFSGSVEKPATPNLFFKTSYLSLNYDLQVNLLKTRHWIVYVSQGAGLIRYNPKDDRNKGLQSQFGTRPEEESYTNITLLLPTQAGAIYLFENGFGLGVQTGWLNSQTDYLDNISQWGNRSKKDNVLQFRFSFLAPVNFQK